MRNPQVMRFHWLHLMLAAGTAAGCGATAAGAPAASRRVVLVELFTSQGCSSCPPADALVRDLPDLGFGRDKVIPLTYHVDYWDDLGWKDPFASADFTRRQAWYGRSKTLRSPDGQSGLEGLYTPQMIVDGLVHFSGQRKADAIREIRHASERPPLFDLTAAAAVHGSVIELAVAVAERGGPSRGLDWHLSVVLAARKARTAVAHGENAGAMLEEAAVARVLSDGIPLTRGPRTSVVVRLSKPADLSWGDIDLVGFVQSEATREIGGTFLLGPAGVRVR